MMRQPRRKQSRSLPILLCILVFISACATNKSYRSSSKVEFPHWIENPQLAGHLVAVGAAMPQNMGGAEAQRRVAVMRARAELARNVRLFLNKQTEVHRLSNNPVTQSQHRISMRAIETQQLVRAVIRAEWQHPTTKELFVWFVSPEQ